MIKKHILALAVILLVASPAFAGQGSFKVNVFPAPPNLSASVAFSEPSGNNILDADETGKIVVTVQNSGKGDAFDVKAEVSSNKRLSGLSYDSTLLLGTISAGGTATKDILLRADEDISTDSLSFNIEIKEANGFDAAPVKLTFKTKAFEPPKLVVADMGIEDQNKNAKVEPMEIVEITARIQNIGHGEAREVLVDVKPGQNVFMAGDGTTRFELGSIQAGRYKDIKFMFYTNNRIKDSEKIPIAIDIKEKRPRFSGSSPLALVMNAPQKKAEEIIVKGADSAPKGEIELATGLSIDVDSNVPEGEKAGKYDIAVVIGNKRYSQSGITDVEFADRDARIIKEYVIKTFGYNPDNIIYAEDATFAKFNEIFGSEKDHKGSRLYKYIKPDVSRVFIYYTGHGAPDLDTKEAYFVPVDANVQYISTNGYKLETFYNNISKMPAKNVTIVLDACFSGNSEKGMLFKNISPAMVMVKKEFKSPSNALLITSAAIDQVSSWYPEKKHSLFTYYFLKGLQGDADANKDKKITAKEMRTYLDEHVPYMARRLTGNEQQPVIMGKDEDVIVVLKK